MIFFWFIYVYVTLWLPEALQQLAEYYELAGIGGRTSRRDILQAIAKHVSIGDDDSDDFVEKVLESDKTVKKRSAPLDPVSEIVLDGLDEDDKQEFKDWADIAKKENQKRKLREMQAKADSMTPTKKKRRQSRSSPAEKRTKHRWFRPASGIVKKRVAGGASASADGPARGSGSGGSVVAGGTGAASSSSGGSIYYIGLHQDDIESQQWI